MYLFYQKSSQIIYQTKRWQNNNLKKKVKITTLSIYIFHFISYTTYRIGGFMRDHIARARTYDFKKIYCECLFYARTVNLKYTLILYIYIVFFLLNDNSCGYTEL